MDAIAALYRTLGPWAVSELVKATVLLLLVFGAAAALRRASAGIRHLVWSAAIVAVLGLPLLSAALPWRLRWLPAQPAAAAEGRTGHTLPAASVAPAAPAVVERATPPAAAPATPSLPRSVPATPSGPRRLTGSDVALALLVLWAGGVGLVLLRLAIGALVVRRIVSQAVALTTPDWTRPLFEAADRLDLSRAPALLQSDRMPMPFASGVLRPAIVLPAGATAWSDRRRRAVLVHELAHVRRFDLLINMLGRLACALYWFHPLVWLTVRRMRADSERAADDTVLSVGTRASEYADHLLQIVCAAGRSSTPAVALPMAQRKEFEGRMLAILEADSRRGSPSRRHALAVAGLALLLVVPTAALTPAAAPASSGVGTASGLHTGTPAGAGPSAAASETAAVQRQQPAAAPRSTLAEDTPETRRMLERSQEATVHAQPVAQDTGNSRVIAALVRALDDPAAEVRENAVYALGVHEAPAAVPAVMRRLRSDDSPKVREMAAWTLGQIESHAATSALGDAARTDRDSTVRATAVWALGQIEDTAAVAALLAALTDRVEDVRGRAAWAIGQIEPRTVPAELLRALRDPAPGVRMRAAWAAGQIEDPAAARPLVPLLEDAAPDVRKAAFWALSRLDGEAARTALLGLLDSRDAELRARAVRALAGRGSDPWPWPWPDPRIR